MRASASSSVRTWFCDDIGDQEAEAARSTGQTSTTLAIKAKDACSTACTDGSSNFFDKSRNLYTKAHGSKLSSTWYPTYPNQEQDQFSKIHSHHHSLRKHRYDQYSRTHHHSHGDHPSSSSSSSSSSTTSNICSSCKLDNKSKKSSDNHSEVDDKENCKDNDGDNDNGDRVARNTCRGDGTGNTGHCGIVGGGDTSNIAGSANGGGSGGGSKRNNKHHKRTCNKAKEDQKHHPENETCTRQCIGRLKKWFHRANHSFGYIECCASDSDVYVYGAVLVQNLGLPYDAIGAHVGRFLEFNVEQNHKGLKAVAPIRFLPCKFKGTQQFPVQNGQQDTVQNASHDSRQPVPEQSCQRAETVHLRNSDVIDSNSLGSGSPADNSRQKSRDKGDIVDFVTKLEGHMEHLAWKHGGLLLPPSALVRAQQPAQIAKVPDEKHRAAHQTTRRHGLGSCQV